MSIMRINLAKHFSLSVLGKTAGLVCVVYRRYNLHFLVKPSCWQLGYHQDQYDGAPLHHLGFGPLALFCWDLWPEDIEDIAEEDKVAYFSSMTFARRLTDHFTRASRKAIASHKQYTGS